MVFVGSFTLGDNCNTARRNVDVFSVLYDFLYNHLSLGH